MNESTRSTGGSRSSLSDHASILNVSSLHIIVFSLVVVVDYLPCWFGLNFGMGFGKHIGY